MTVNCYPAASCLDDAKEGQGEAALSCAGPPADANLFLGPNVHVNTLEDEVEARSVPDSKVLKRDSTLLRPFFRQQLFALGNLNIRLLWVLGVLEDPLDGNGVCLEIAEHPDQPVEGVRHIKGVGDGQSCESGANEAPAQNGEDGGEENHEVANGLDPHAQPSVAAHAEVETTHTVHDMRLRLCAEAILLLESANRGHSIDALREVRENGALLDRLDPLQLTRSGYVVPLHEKVHSKDRWEDSEEEWRRVRDNENHAQDLKKAV